MYNLSDTHTSLYLTIFKPFHPETADYGVYAVGKLGADELYIYALKNRLKKDLDEGLKRFENRLKDVLGIVDFRLVVSDSGSEEEAIERLFRQHSHLKPMDEWVTTKALKLLSLLI